MKTVIHYFIKMNYIEKNYILEQQINNERARLFYNHGKKKFLNLKKKNVLTNNIY